MAGPGLPTNVDTAYADSGADASVKTHQQHHDAVHAIVNKFDTATPTVGQVPVWNGTVYAPATAPGSASIDDVTVSAGTVFSSSKSESQYLNAASNLSDLAAAATARVNLGVDRAPYYLDEVSGAYPNRPARTGPVVWRGPDAPGSGGTTAGGTANAVASLDEWHRQT